MKFADQKLREEEQRGEKYLESFSGSIKNVSGLKLFNFFFVLSPRWDIYGP